MLMGASICCALAETDTQFTILALSAMKKQCIIFDKLVLYSDGVPEATNLAGHQFGNTRFMECLEKNGDLPASKLVRQIVDTTGEWTRGTAPFDDLILLVVEAK